MTEEETAKAISEIKSALRQVLSVQPQLLFRACMDTFSEIMIENLALGAKVGGYTKPDRFKLNKNRRMMIALQMIGTSLLRDGSAHLEEQDLKALDQYTALYK